MTSAHPSLPSEFARIYWKYASRVYRYVYAHVGNREDAEDLTAQTFFQALEKWPAYHEQGSMAAWLFTIARRRVADYHRQRRSFASLEAARSRHNDDPSPLDVVIREEDMAHLAQLITDLTEDERELLRLRFAAELTYREIALLLNRSQPAVKMAIRRLIQRLTRMWETTHDHA